MSTELAPRAEHSLGRPVVRACAALVVAVGIALAGCATTATTTPVVEQLTQARYAPTQTVDVLATAPAAAFERIARLRLSDPTGVATQSQLVAQLADSAKALGANALVVEQVTRSGAPDVGFNPAGGQMQATGSGGAMTVTALAIRYTP